MSAIPPKWQPKYIIRRIDARDITIPKNTRDKILQALDEGLRFVQIGEYTIMLNAIRSIDPMWGAKNIPPRPKELYEYRQDGSNASRTLVNKSDIDLWDELFGEASKKVAIEEWSEK